jgi:tRNA U34 5-methylaminomethyl-2-thiouridine-forming methyltransferase MnmC
LPDRFRDGFHIAELGFGTGLNFLATAHSWRECGCSGTLRFTSFEAFPMRADDMAKALSAFDSFGSLREALLAAWTPEGGDFRIVPDLHLKVVIGDARDSLCAWRGLADAWFLDGFSPAKNPELWSEELMGEVAAHTAPGGTCATYSAAGFVRRGLDAAGFDVERAPGFGRKRHMTRAVMR